MKKLKYIIPAILVITSSCTSSLFTGVAYDDLYYRPSDNPVVVAQTGPATSSGQQYYDNVFSSDTLIADEYEPYEEFAYQEPVENQGTVVNNYYGTSPTDNIYLFSDSYFYPYWRDPFYFSPFSASFYYGSFYNPYYSYPYWYDYNDYYYGYYPYWGSYYYGYNPYSYYPGYYYGYANYPANDYYSRYSGHRGGTSTSVRGNYAAQPRSVATLGSSYSSRQVSSTYGQRRIATSNPADTKSATTGSLPETPVTGRRVAGTQEAAPAYNRPAGGYNSSTPNPGYSRRESTATQTQTANGTQTQNVNRPQYQTTQRTYTPSYSNPKMSSRPSYNNTRSATTSSGSSYNNGSSAGRSSGSTSSYRGSGSSSGSSQGSRSSVQYSSPSRVSSGSSSTRSSGGSSYSSGSSGGSYRGGGSSSSSSSSSSGGSSRSSSSSSSSSGGGDGGGRRR